MLVNENYDEFKLSPQKARNSIGMAKCHICECNAWMELVGLKRSHGLWHNRTSMRWESWHWCPQDSCETGDARETGDLKAMSSTNAHSTTAHPSPNLSVLFKSDHLKLNCCRSQKGREQWGKMCRGRVPWPAIVSGKVWWTHVNQKECHSAGFLGIAMWNSC